MQAGERIQPSRLSDWSLASYSEGNGGAQLPASQKEELSAPPSHTRLRHASRSTLGSKVPLQRFKKCSNFIRFQWSSCEPARQTWMRGNWDGNWDVEETLSIFECGTKARRKPQDMTVSARFSEYSTVSSSSSQPAIMLISGLGAAWHSSIQQLYLSSTTFLKPWKCMKTYESPLLSFRANLTSVDLLGFFQWVTKCDNMWQRWKMFEVWWALSRPEELLLAERLGGSPRAWPEGPGRDPRDIPRSHSAAMALQDNII